MLKKTIITLIIWVTVSCGLYAQVQHPVKWAYGTKKLGPDTYALHLRATMEQGWHVYSQQQPDNAVSEPTKFIFDLSSQFTLVGKVKEVGRMQRFEDPGSGLGANQYSDQVDFVQVIKVKDTALKVVTGTLTYQTCTDHMCLSPEDVKFSIPIN